MCACGASTLLFAAIAVSQTQTAAPDSAPFLPSFEAASRPLLDWIERFEGSGFADHDALWCVAWHPDSSQTSERFRDWLGQTQDDRIRRDLEAILHHREIEHECTLEAMPAASFDPTIQAPEVPVTEALLELDSLDRNTTLLAAKSLIRARVEVPRVARTLVTRPDLSATRVRPLLELIGLEADRALCHELTDPNQSPVRLASLLKELAFTSSVEPEDVAPTLAWLAARRELEMSYVAELALAKLASLVVQTNLWRETTLESAFEFHLYVHATRREPIPSSTAARELGACLASRLRSLPGRATPRNAECNLIVLACARSPDVAAAVEPILRDWLVDTSARRSLAASVLTHAGIVAPDLDEAVAYFWDGWQFDGDSTSPTTAWSIPCPRSMSNATRQALTNAFDRSSPQARFEFCLSFESCGRIDSSHDPQVAAMLEALNSDPRAQTAFYWSHLIDFGFHAELDVDPAATPVANLYRLGMTVIHRESLALDSRDAKARLLDYFIALPEPPGAYGYTDTTIWGLDLIRRLLPTEPDFDRWCVEWLVHGDPWKYHAEEFARFLETRELRAADRALVLHPSGAFVPPVFPDLAARQGEVALETVALWPRLIVHDSGDAVPRFDCSGIERLLRITKLADSDLFDLASGLRFGIARDRIEILELIERHRLDHSILRSAIEHAVHDCDSRVAQRASAWLAANQH